MSKDNLRCTMRKLNLSIGLGERIEVAYNIFSTIEMEQIFIESGCVAIFLALPDEPTTLNIVERWHKMGKRVVLPRVVGDEMEFVEYSPNTLRKGAFGILEPTGNIIASPSQIELMVVPGVAFTNDGGRLGRGKGYYDKYLSQPDFRGYTIGIGYAHQLVEELPCEPHDVKLSRVITPSKANTAATLTEVIIKIIDAAGVAAIQLGCGVEKLISNGLTWVLSRLSVEIFTQPESMDDIMIDTWIEDCNRIASTRNFTLSNRAGERIGVATSQWCMIDMKARRPIDLTSAEFDYTNHVHPRGLDIKHPRKIQQIEGDQIRTSHHTATELDIDINNHVNTMRYIEMMLSMVDNERREKYAPIHLDLHFIKESILGDKLTINSKEQSIHNGTQLLFEIIKPDGSPSVRALFDYLS